MKKIGFQKALRLAKMAKRWTYSSNFSIGRTKVKLNFLASFSRLPAIYWAKGSGAVDNLVTLESVDIEQIRSVAKGVQNTLRSG